MGDEDEDDDEDDDEGGDDQDDDVDDDEDEDEDDDHDDEDEFIHFLIDCFMYVFVCVLFSFIDYGSANTADHPFLARRCVAKLGKEEAQMGKHVVGNL